MEIKAIRTEADYLAALREVPFASWVNQKHLMPCEMQAINFLSGYRLKLSQQRQKRQRLPFKQSP